MSMEKGGELSNDYQRNNPVEFDIFMSNENINSMGKCGLWYRSFWREYSDYFDNPMIERIFRVEFRIISSYLIRFGFQTFYRLRGNLDEMAKWAMLFHRGILIN